jgi:hypothetical protein
MKREKEKSRNSQGGVIFIFPQENELVCTVVILAFVKASTDNKQ